VQESVYEKFIEALKRNAEKCAIGQPSDDATSFGPLISEAQRDKVLGYVESGKSEGARLVTGGNKWKNSGEGYWVEPTILADVSDSMKVVQEEVRWLASI
jgi:aldehyde dehydrogenase (NAD+)